MADEVMRLRERAAKGVRWSPTERQLEVLKSLYNMGIHTPKDEDIERIVEMLSHYGSVEAKNVFYWFQNHRAHQRLKLNIVQRRASHSSSAECLTLQHCASVPPISFVPANITPLPHTQDLINSFKERRGERETLELFPLNPEELGMRDKTIMDDQQI